MCNICLDQASAPASSSTPLFDASGSNGNGFAAHARHDFDFRPPHRGEFIIRNAYVITMNETFGEQPSSSVHVRDGVIVAIGSDVEVSGTQVIDGTGMIVLPGLIDTHWHMWHTILRSFSGDTKETGFYPTITRFAASMSAEDMYHSTSGSDVLPC